MKNMIGKTINIPESLHNGIKKIKKEQEISFQSAKILMSEVQGLKKSMFEILGENMDELSGYDYHVDTKEMNIVIIRKKD